MAKLLIVEDDLDILNLLEVFLTGKGYTVALAKNGKEALAKCKEAVPDVLIADIMMPEMNGYQLVQELSNDHYDIPMPKVIFLTSRTGAADVQRGLSVGADMYITKPFDMNELAARVEELLESKAKEPDGT